MQTQVQTLKYFTASSVSESAAGGSKRRLVGPMLLRFFGRLLAILSNKENAATAYNFSLLQGTRSPHLITTRAWQRHSAFICYQQEIHAKK